VSSPLLPHFLLKIIATVFAWRWRDRPPPVHLYFALAGCRVASCRSTSASASRFYDALRPSFVLLQCNLCLSLSRGAAGFRDDVASCLLVPPLPFASHTSVGCCDASLLASCQTRRLSRRRCLLFADASPPILPLVRPDWLSPLVHWLCRILTRRLRLLSSLPRLSMAAASCHAGDSTSRSPLVLPDWLSCCLLRPLLLTSTSLPSLAPQSSLPPLSMPRPRRRSTQRKAPAAEADSGRRVGVKRSSLHLQLSCRRRCAYTGEE
jgi:hypothetical protein